MTQVVEVPLVNNRGIALVDAGDAERVLQHRWSLHVKGRVSYARCQTSEPRVTMHRFIVDPPGHLDVDHRNHNGLDNRRQNLRLATTLQNVANTRSRHGASSSYKGVSWDADRRRWAAQIMIDGANRKLGRFHTEDEAAVAYDAAALKAWGEFAYLNFPEGERAA